MSEVKKNKKIPTSIRLDSNLYDKIVREANRRKRSMAFVIEEKLRKTYEKG